MSGTSVTILAYHAIEDGPGPVCISPATFERQIAGLAEAGCAFLGMDAVLGHLETGAPLPDRAVALTFDDAYDSVHRVALPLLDRLGVVATVFPVTSQLGGHNQWDHAAGTMPELRLVTRSQLHELEAAGWEVGGHTHTHRPLSTLTPQELESELATSDAVLEDELGHTIRSFAYPYGVHDHGVRRQAAARYGGCLVIGASRARPGGSLDRIGRVDAWYLQRSWQIAALPGPAGDVYLAARRLIRGVRARLLPA